MLMPGNCVFHAQRVWIFELKILQQIAVIGGIQPMAEEFQTLFAHHQVVTVIGDRKCLAW